jgi:hypothetical protein
LSIIQGPFSVAPCQTLISRFATFPSLCNLRHLLARDVPVLGAARHHASLHHRHAHPAQRQRCAHEHPQRAAAHLRACVRVWVIIDGNRRLGPRDGRTEDTKQRQAIGSRPPCPRPGTSPAAEQRRQTSALGFGVGREDTCHHIHVCGRAVRLRRRGHELKQNPPQPRQWVSTLQVRSSWQWEQLCWVCYGCVTGERGGEHVQGLR